MHQTVLEQSVFNQIAQFLNRKFPLRSHAVSNKEAILQVLRVLRYGVERYQQQLVRMADYCYISQMANK
jgi:hypothetical protein